MYTFSRVDLYPHGNGFRLDWCGNLGFGILLFTVLDTGEIELDSEFMSKDFVKAALAALVDQAVDRHG